MTRGRLSVGLCLGDDGQHEGNGEAEEETYLGVGQGGLCSRLTKAVTQCCFVKEERWCESAVEVSPRWGEFTGGRAEDGE